MDVDTARNGFEKKYWIPSGIKWNGDRYAVRPGYESIEALTIDATRMTNWFSVWLDAIGFSEQNKSD